MTALPLLDHLIQQMQEQFGEHQIFVSCIKTALRSTMGQEWLSSLVMMSIHNDMPINFDVIVDRFKLVCNRRIVL